MPSFADEVHVTDSSGLATVKLEGNQRQIIVGADNRPGKVFVTNRREIETVRIRGEHATASEQSAAVAGAQSGADDLVASGLDLTGDQIAAAPTDLELAGDAVAATTPVPDLDGDEDAAGPIDGVFDPNRPLGGSIEVCTASGLATVILSGSRGSVLLVDNQGRETIHIDGMAGDIMLSGADAAEDFAITPGHEAVPPGTVMVIDELGSLRESHTAYDRRVAGVVSGAGNLRPGIVLGRTRSHPGRLPIALVGKVYCQVDASSEPVRVGDLLTTAELPGHAMKAEDPNRAFGAVIGKALQPLISGRGLIPVLVALQ